MFKHKLILLYYLVSLLLICGCSDTPDADGESSTEACQDKLDNDNDGHIDCHDQGCWGYSFCNSEDISEDISEIQPDQISDPNPELEEVCIGSCEDRQCGEDGCGISCGTCGEEGVCIEFQCRQDCYGGMCPVSEGAFMMGCHPDDSGCDDDELPYHEVLLDGYSIDQTEVTQNQYKECLEAGICSEPECRWDPDSTSNYPVVCINFNDAKIFCNWAEKRLCSEAEWEKAARGTDGQHYPWGNNPPDCDNSVMYLEECSEIGVQETGSRPAGDSPYGVQDMAGNVFEWIEDWYDAEYYGQCPVPCQNPQGATGGMLRIKRGGCFGDNNPNNLRTSYRGVSSSGDINVNLGFRCCR